MLKTLDVPASRFFALYLFSCLSCLSWAMTHSFPPISGSITCIFGVAEIEFHWHGHPARLDVLLLERFLK